MEIERKWMVNGWPEDFFTSSKNACGPIPSEDGSAALPLLREQTMRQGYISVRPTVRIREEAETGGGTEYILCFKSAADQSGLSRQEIEIPVSPETFSQLEALIGIPLIPKLRRTYLLPDGHHLEVSLVDEGLPTEFMYAEIEYGSEAQARAWDPAAVGLADYLDDDVTGQPGQSMGAYWELTRLHRQPAD